MRKQYDFATEALRAGGQLRSVQVTIGALCASTAVLGWVVEPHPLGPHDSLSRLVHLAVTSSAMVVAAAWVIRPWPSFRWAVGFTVWADLGLTVAAALLSTPAARLCAAIHMGMVGVFIAFLLGWRVLAVHCAFATVVIIGFTAYGAARHQASWFDLYIYWAPALSTVILLPLLLQTVIDGARRNLTRTMRAALHDPLTKLYNRWGLQTAMQNLAVDPSLRILVAAVIDLDGFKALNDSEGHGVGDAALENIGALLRRQTRAEDIVARTGGDEFVVVASVSSADGVQQFVERIAAAVRQEGHVTASVGVASQQDDVDSRRNLDTLLHRADRLMYEAKRRGGNQVVRSHGDTAPRPAERASMIIRPPHPDLAADPA